MTRDVKAEARAINTILWKDWDPIGCGVPADEYESYNWPLYQLLIVGGSRDEIAEHLRLVAMEHLCVASPEDRLPLVLDKLMALGLAQPKETNA